MGSGRSGTLQIANFLDGFSGYSAKHERDFENMLKIGVLSYYGEGASAEANRLVYEYNKKRRACIKNSNFVDVSNAREMRCPLW